MVRVALNTQGMSSQYFFKHIYFNCQTHAFVSSEDGYATVMGQSRVLEEHQEQAGGDNLEAPSGELKLELY